MRTDELDYDLPPERIAQVPPPRREDARLLVLDRRPPALSHRTIEDLPGLLDPGDLLVLNDTRVIPARLFARRDTGGRVEVLLLEPDGDAWTALARAGGTLREGERLAVGDAGALRLVDSLGEGHWRVAAEAGGVEALMADAGRMPLPPYIHRDEDDARAGLDRERYQTTFAKKDGAIAAPTAGLHVTQALLAALEAREVEMATLTLHVGLGTFEPVRSAALEDHEMHEERYEIPVATAEAVARVKAAGGRVVAVGTTSVRALEAAATDGGVRPGAATTRLLILPGARFQVVDALLTNFHLPRSTLLALVAALAGTARILDAYQTAVAEGYRFYSYGDAMLIR